jgi:hypothetical protein
LLEVPERFSQSTDELIDALVVKDNRDTAWGCEDGHSVPDDDGIRKVDFLASSAHRHNRKWAERASPFESLNSPSEYIAIHVSTPDCEQSYYHTPLW